METDLGIVSESTRLQIDVSSEQWYHEYATTVGILAVTHAIYIYHVAAKSERSSVVVSYDILIRKRQYHRALLALLSHPTSNRPQQRESQNAIDLASSPFVFERIQEWQRSSVLCNGKRFSGLPLLLYNSFILWECRELESMVGTAKYARLLWGIAVVSMLLEISLTYCILSFLRDMNYGTSSPLLTMSRGGQPPASTLQVKRMFLHRSMGSLTIVSTGVLTVFQNHVHKTPISMVPFVNANLLFIVNPSIAYAFCLGVLFFLSRSAHPFSAVICGACAGLTWSANLSSFMMEVYWANGSFLFYILLCMVSLKASKSSLVPCIDYKPWDSNGQFPLTPEHYDYLPQSDSSSNLDSLGVRGSDFGGNLWLYPTRNDDSLDIIPNIGEMYRYDDSNQNEQEFDHIENASTLTPAVDSTSSADAGVRSRRALLS